MSTSAIKDQLTEAMKAAMRAKDKARLGVVRLMLADIKRKEVDDRVELDDTQVLAVLDKMAKQRRESIEQFDKASRTDLADKERAELGVIQEFLPAALTEAEIDAIVAAALAETGASTIKDMGKVMGIIRPQVQGRADMAVVSARIKNKLA